MTVISWQVYNYSLPLQHPLAVKGRTISERNGFVLRFVDSNDHEGWGEIAPLSNFSLESPTEAEEQLRRLSSDLLNTILKDPVDSTSDYGLCPSVDFGIRSALLNLRAAREHQRVASLLAQNVADSVRVNALLDGRSEEIEKQATDFLTSGYTTFKLKLGRGSLSDDIEKYRRLRNLIPDDTKLRLDGNRSWSTTELIQFADSVPLNGIEYIEEPLRDIADYATLPGDFAFPLALDESLMSAKPEDFLALRNLRCLVLKPTCLGLGKCLGLVKAARTAGIDLVFTSTFESSIGVGFVAELAAAFMPAGKAAGLGTLDWFAHDLLKSPLEVNDGILSPRGTPLSFEDVVLERIKKVCSNA